MNKTTRATVALFSVVCVTFSPLPVASSSIQDDRSFDICDRASVAAAKRSKVPLRILKAVARTESGITQHNVFRPWPWTVNIGGAGAYLRSKSEALNHITSHLRAGRTNIDIGCFQVNYRWHGEHFSSPQEMLDPHVNAQYAADFLSNLFDEFGDWERAAGAYHSRNAINSDAYLKKFRPILTALDTGAATPTGNTASDQKRNSFPLLRAGKRGRTPGSLFTTAAVPRNRFIENPALED